MSTSSTPPMAAKLISSDDDQIIIAFTKPYQGSLFMGFLNLTKVTPAPTGGISGALVKGTSSKGSTTELEVDQAHFDVVRPFDDGDDSTSFTVTIEYETSTRKARKIICASVAATAAPAAE